MKFHLECNLFARCGIFWPKAVNYSVALLNCNLNVKYFYDVYDAGKYSYPRFYSVAAYRSIVWDKFCNETHFLC